MKVYLRCAVLLAACVCTWVLGDAMRHQGSTQPSRGDTASETESPEHRPPGDRPRGSVEAGPAWGGSIDLRELDGLLLAEADDPEPPPDEPPPPRRPGAGLRARRGFEERAPNESPDGPPDGPPGPRPHWPGRDSDEDRLSPEEVRDILEFARKHMPELHKRLLMLREADPEKFREMLPRVRPPLKEIGQEMELRGMRQDYLAAKTDADRDAIKARMRERVAQVVEMRLEHARKQVRAFEEKLKKAKQELAEKEQSKDTLIDREVTKWLSDKPPPPPGGPFGKGAGRMERERERGPGPRNREGDRPFAPGKPQSSPARE